MDVKDYRGYFLSMGALLPAPVMAVTLGDMTIQSSLNQPLKAYIELSHLDGTPLSGIKVRLASPRAFKHVGIPRPYGLSQLRFSIGREGQTPVVFITSTGRIDSPFLQVLLDVTWAKGQYYRNYTVLLDPPNYAYQTKATKVKGSSYRFKIDKQGKTYQTTTKVHVDKTIVKPTQKAKTVSQRLTHYGPVKAHEDLWKIAKAYQKPGLSLQQIMLAILEYNPKAFQHENINGLKKDVILIIPNQTLMASIPADKAKLEVLAQVDAWNNNKPIKHVITPPYLKTRGKKIEPKNTSTLAKISLDGLVSKEKAKEVLKKKPPILPKANAEKMPALAAGNQSTHQVIPKPPKKPKKKEMLFDDFMAVPDFLNRPVMTNKKGTNIEPAPPKSTTKTTLEQPETTPVPVQINRSQLSSVMKEIATLKHSNVKLQQQVQHLVKENLTLKASDKKQQQAMQQLRKELRRLAGTIKQTQPLGEDMGEDSVINFTLWIFILLGVVVGGSFVALYLRQQGYFNRRVIDSSSDTTEPDDELPEVDTPASQIPIDSHSDATVIITEVEVDEIEEEDDDIEVDDEPKPDVSDELAEVDTSPSHDEVSIGKDSYAIPIDSYDVSDLDAVGEIISQPAAEATSEEILEESDITLSYPDTLDADSSSITTDAELDEASLPNLEKEKSVEEESQEGTQDESASDPYVLDFEEGLSPTLGELQEQTSEAVTSTLDKTVTDEPISYDALSLTDESDDDSPSVEENEPKKSVNVDTLLDLAKTYISMEDIESALDALEEVKAKGGAKAQEEAATLLEKIKKS